MAESTNSENILLYEKFESIYTIQDFVNVVLPLYSKVWIQYHSIPFYIPLYQRPQHICTNISKFNFLSIFMEINRDGKYKEIEYIKKHNIWIYRCDLEKILCLDNQKIYISVCSTIPIPYEDLYIKIKHNKNVNLIYDYIDDINMQISGSDVTVKTQIKNQSFAFENFNIFIASSNNLFEKLPKNKKRILINNGCDTKHYESKLNKNYTGNEFKNQYDKLCKFKNEYLTILGYFGAIAPWLDYNIINDITQKRNDIGFVFIGPDYLDQIKNIKVYENVLLLGSIDYNILPYFAFNFDVCFIPFEEGNIAKTTSPLKLYEYFSMKKPVICSKYMLECVQYEEVLSYDNLHSLNECIDKSIGLLNDKKYLNKLLKIAQKNTWEKLCKKLVDFIKSDKIVTHVESKKKTEEIFLPCVAIFIQFYDDNYENLKNCIDSALKIDYSNKDIILLSNKNTDTKFLKNYSDKIHIFTLNNDIFSSNLNTVLHLSKNYDFVTWSSTKNIWNSDFIISHLNHHSKNVTITYSDFYTIGKNKNFKKSANLRKNISDYDDNIVIVDDVNVSYKNMIDNFNFFIGPSFLINTKIFSSLSDICIDYCCVEETIFWLEMFNNDHKFKKINNPLCYLKCNMGHIVEWSVQQNMDLYKSYMLYSSVIQNKYIFSRKYFYETIKYDIKVVLKKKYKHRMIKYFKKKNFVLNGALLKKFIKWLNNINIDEAKKYFTNIKI